MTRKTKVLQFFMVLFAVSGILDIAEGFYIWACMQEFGFYEVTVPGVVMFNLLGMVVGYPLMIAYIKSVWKDYEAAEEQGVLLVLDIMKDSLEKAILEGEDGEGER